MSHDVKRNEVRLNVHTAHLNKSIEIHKKDCQAECRNKQQKKITLLTISEDIFPGRLSSVYSCLS